MSLMFFTGCMLVSVGIAISVYQQQYWVSAFLFSMELFLILSKIIERMP